MNNRDKLLAGAKQCLTEKGYARTTTQDIAAAAGVSLGAIGYHFGTREVLLNAALHQAVEELGEALGRNLADLDPLDPTTVRRLRFEQIWSRVITSVDEQRPLWQAQFEIFVQAQHNTELREHLVASVTEGRYGLAELFAGLGPAADQREAWLVGSVYQFLLVGMAMQWLLEPDRALSANDLANALQLLTANLNA